MTALATVNTQFAAPANTWGLIPPLGHVDAYISAVNKMPMLTLEQEQDCARRLKNDNDLDAAGKLIMSHLRLVVSVSRQYLGYGLPHADLIQEGNVGLMKAVKRFDPAQGVRLVSYAMHWIKAEIHEYILRNWRMVKLATTKSQRKLFFNLRSKKQGFKAETDDDGEESFGPIAYLTDTNHEPTAVMESHQRDVLATDGLSLALNSLDERSRRIVQERWLNVKDDGSGAMTLHDLADEFGVSAERIRQIEASAMKKMKTALLEFA